MNATVSLHTGRIKVAAPFQNQYLVVTELEELMATGLETGSGRRGGHIGGGAYVPGAIVLVAKIDITSEITSRIAFPNMILGAFNPYTTFDKTDFQPTWIQQDSQSDAIRNQAYRRVLEGEPSTLLNENRGANRPLDVLPGDWFKSTVLGGLFLLSDFMARVGSSPDCKISFNGIDQLAEIVSINFSADHASVFRELIHRGLTAVDVSRYALTISEGLGSPKPLKEVENTEEPWRLEPVIENQTGFFRDERFSGGAVEGAWRFCRTDLGNPSDPHTFGPNLYPGVFSEMARMDGIYRLRAAKEICFEKTAAIVTPWLLQELRGAPPAPDTDEEEVEQVDIEFRKDLMEAAETTLAPGLSGGIDVSAGSPPVSPTAGPPAGEEEEKVTDDEVYAMMPLLYDVFSTAEEAKVFFKGLRKDGHIWHFPTKEDIERCMFSEGEEVPVEKEGGTRVLRTEEREYTLRDLVSRDLEIYPGRKVKLFRNSSVFLMSDDGGITIGDGFGGEIRMHRGRVTIASIGDIEFLPGRDLIEQVPGNRITRAGGRVEMSSTDGSVAIKAQTNMQLVSGGDKGGILTVENRSPARNLSDVTEKELLQDKPFGSGIMLKCVGGSGISLLGSHIYGAGYSPGSESVDGVASTSIPCDIVLDAGSKDLMLSGTNGIMSFRNSVALTLMQSVTGLYMNSGSILGVANSSVSVVSPEVRVEGIDAASVRPLLRSTGIRFPPSFLPKTPPQMIINGGLSVGAGGIVSEGRIATEGDVTANGGVGFPKGSKHDFKLDDGVVDRTKEIQRTLDETYRATRSLLQNMVSQGVATERGQRVTEFAFPDSETYRAGGLKFVAPKWQTILAADARPWIERSVAHAILEQTFPYPGREAHESTTALITRKGNTVEKGPLAAYKTNLPAT